MKEKYKDTRENPPIPASKERTLIPFCYCALLYVLYFEAVSTCVMTCDLTCDSVPVLARQRKRLPCSGASYANAGTKSQVESQVIMHCSRRLTLLILTTTDHSPCLGMQHLHIQDRRRELSHLSSKDLFSHAEEVQLELQGRPETWLKVAQHDGTTFLMGSIYREWVPDARERAEHFGNMLSYLQERYTNILIAGDFNLDFDINK
jgi:hypothetical protein